MLAGREQKGIEQLFHVKHANFTFLILCREMFHVKRLIHDSAKATKDSVVS